MILKKTVFWLFVLLNNGFAIGLIGIAFLSGPAADEGASTTVMSFFEGLLVYATMVSLIFGGVTFLLAYLFRDVLVFSKRTLFLFYAVNFTFLLVIFCAIYLYVYVL